MIPQLPESQPARKQQGVIQTVVGHGTARGMPEAFEITLARDDGTVLHARIPTPSGDRRTAGVLRGGPSFYNFGCCPICLTPEAVSREHVPPHSVGGSVLTTTCDRCNHEFGSRFEPSLNTWYERSVSASITGCSVLGSRRLGAPRPVRGLYRPAGPRIDFKKVLVCHSVFRGRSLAWTSSARMAAARGVNGTCFKKMHAIK